MVLEEDPPESKDDSGRADLLFEVQVGLVMFAIRYEKNIVTDTEVSQRQRALDLAPKERKIGRWMALNHFGRLQSWQHQGYHCHYLSGTNEYHCTCGLVILKEGSGEPALKISGLVADRVLNELKPDEVQSHLGHRNLPSGRGLTAALLTNFLWVEKERVYKWRGFCQVCGSMFREEPKDSAWSFVDSHNKSCKKSLKNLLAG